MDKLFQYEISLPPPSFLSGAEVNMCKAKSSLMGCLVDENIDLLVEAQCSAVLVDGSLIAQSNRPKCIETIGAYIEQVYLTMILRHLLRYERVDVLFDRYFDLSIKGVTRVNRGIGGRYHIMPNTPIPRKWKEFLIINAKCPDLSQITSVVWSYPKESKYFALKMKRSSDFQQHRLMVYPPVRMRRLTHALYCMQGMPLWLVIVAFS